MIKERGFYTRLLAMMLPLAIQELINFCVQILDTVMVGSLGDHAVSAVLYLRCLCLWINICRSSDDIPILGTKEYRED